MTGIRDVTPPERYSFEERHAARLVLRKSRFFLVLGLSPDFGSELNRLPPAITTCSAPDFVLRQITLTSKKEKPTPALRRAMGRAWSREGTRVLLELKGRQSPKSRAATATRIVSAIGALFSHVHHTAYASLAPYQIPKELARGKEVSVEQIEELEARAGVYGQTTDLRMQLGSGVWIPPSSTATIFYLLPFVLQDNDLFDACNFFRSCVSEFSFMDGVARDLLDDPDREAEDETERLAFEHIVLQSFRTIEALVGEPGSNVDRFRERLTRWNIRHDERVGFPGRPKRKLEDRIRWLHDARDSATAHGKRRRTTPFTVFEAMEAQHLADSMLTTALWWTADSRGRQGDEHEVGFLLEEMIRGSLEWSLGGKRAVDLARTPGGLSVILEYRRKQT